MDNIGFIGIGVMGYPMAVNLLRAGYPLSFLSRNREKVEALIKLGGVAAESPRQVAEASDVVITMLPDTRVVEEVLFEGQGVIQGLRSGKVVIDMSTISPLATVDFAARLAAVGCEMLDAPVSGGEKGAIEGTLAIMVGGASEIFEKVQAVFRAMGKTITYTGPNGNGQKTKLVNQLVGATNLLGAIEGVRLARAAGLNPEITLQAISNGAASSWMLTNLAPRILKADFAPGFSIRLQQKDMKLLKEWASGVGDDFPATDLVYSLFTKALELNLGDQGNQGLINVWEQ